MTSDGGNFKLGMDELLDKGEEGEEGDRGEREPVERGELLSNERLLRTMLPTIPALKATH
tara:strand:- start:85 stop:264 length:180 start_codon:yes stop_codon:yes gene_type:complete